MSVLVENCWRTKLINRMFTVQLWVSMLLATFGITMALGAREPTVPRKDEYHAEILQLLPDGSPIEARHAEDHSWSVSSSHLLQPWCSALLDCAGS